MKSITQTLFFSLLSIAFSCNKEDLPNNIDTKSDIQLSSQDPSDLLDNLDFSSVTNTDEAYLEWQSWLTRESLPTNYGLSQSEVVSLMENSANQNFNLLSSSEFSSQQVTAILDFRSDFQSGQTFQSALNGLSSDLSAVTDASSSQIDRGDLLLDALDLLFSNTSGGSPTGPPNALISPCADACIGLTCSVIGLAASSCVGLGAVGFIGVVFGSAAVEENC